MKLNEEEILKRANEIYIDSRYDEYKSAFKDTSLVPWTRQEFIDATATNGIRSSQVKALCKALVEAVNGAGDERGFRGGPML